MTKMRTEKSRFGGEFHAILDFCAKDWVKNAQTLPRLLV